jgi:hypothetical protein
MNEADLFLTTLGVTLFGFLAGLCCGYCLGCENGRQVVSHIGTSPRCRVCSRPATGGYIIERKELSGCMEHPVTDEEILVLLDGIHAEQETRTRS